MVIWIEVETVQDLGHGARFFWPRPEGPVDVAFAPGWLPEHDKAVVTVLMPCAAATAAQIAEARKAIEIYLEYGTGPLNGHIGGGVHVVMHA